jgi:hypothetical protein
MLEVLKSARKLNEEEFLLQVRAVLKSVYLEGMRDGVKLLPEEMNELAYEDKAESHLKTHFDDNQRSETT